MFDVYYNIDSTKWSQIAKDSIVIFDTSSLFSIYRFPIGSLEDLLNVLDSIRTRLKVPYSVSLEYHDNLKAFLDGSTKSMNREIENMTRAVSEMDSLIRFVRVNSDKNLTEIISKSNSVKKQMHETIEIANEAIATRKIANQNISQRLKYLLFQNNDSEFVFKNLDQIEKDGEFRSKHNIAPQSKEQEKRYSQKESPRYLFVNPSFKINKKYIDTYTWNEIVNFAKQPDVKSILYVTDDLKSNWYKQTERGNYIPNPDLLREMASLNLVNSFYISNFSDFYTIITEELNTPLDIKVELGVKLEKAQNYIDDNEIDIAAITTGVALEKFIKFLAEKNEINIYDSSPNGDKVKKKANRLNADLYKAKAYSQSYMKSITAWMDIRNSAAHGNESFTASQVRLMNEGVTMFIRDYDME